MGDEEDLSHLPPPLFSSSIATSAATTSTSTVAGTSTSSTGTSGSTGVGPSDSTAPSSSTTAGTIALSAQAFVALSNIGVRAPRIFDNKKETDFRSWVMRLERFMALANIPADRYTSILLLDLDP